MSILSYLIEFDWLGIVFISLLIGSAILTWISRGVQLRALPLMVRLLCLGPRVSLSHGAHANNSIDPRKALLTAMSTTIGIGNIFGPIVAIAFAGPGALLTYILATLLGSASTYTEVFFSVRYRKKFADGSIQAGPMAYIQEVMPKPFAMLYAVSGSILLAVWSMSQSHTVAHMISSHGIPCAISGAILGFVLVYAIFNGIHWIAELNTKLVPLMFFLYIGSGGYILAQHLDRFFPICNLIWTSFWSPTSLIAGVTVYSVFDVLRWGLARAFQSNEAGVGTSTIPHSLSQTDSPAQQAVLAMASVYSNGIICLISGLIFLMSGAYDTAAGRFDASLVNEIFREHFSFFGEPLILIITLLFALGTILGNAYNGTRCFAYMTSNRWTKWYALGAGICVFIGTTLDLKAVWAHIDYLMVPVALPHTIALILLARRHREIYNLRIQNPKK